MKKKKFSWVSHQLVFLLQVSQLWSWSDPDPIRQLDPPPFKKFGKIFDLKKFSRQGLIQNSFDIFLPLMKFQSMIGKLIVLFDSYKRSLLFRERERVCALVKACVRKAKGPQKYLSTTWSQILDTLKHIFNSRVNFMIAAHPSCSKTTITVFFLGSVQSF